MSKVRTDAIPVVIDTDPGVDDALALALAFASPELTVRAVTTVAGNVDLETATANAVYLLDLLAPDHAPRLAKGCAEPLARTLVTAEDVHGSDGLAGVTGLDGWHRPDTSRRLAGGSAVDVIVDEIGGSAEPVTLIALGPLTNVAAAISRDPAVMRRVASLVVMGGSLYAGGNVTPHAEFNFYVDPEAADLVLAAGLPLTLVPLDVTHQLVVRDETIEGRLLALKDRRSRFLGELIKRTRHEGCGDGRLILHDPGAVASVLWPELFTLRPYDLTVDRSHGDRRGAVSARMAETPARRHERPYARLWTWMQRPSCGAWSTGSRPTKPAAPEARQRCRPRRLHRRSLPPSVGVPRSR